MSTKSPPVQTNASANPSDQGDDSKKKSDAAKVPRKRTKTGCLTCRKRRIKCDEDKPTCANCTKSRRHCEGYNPRIVFRRSRTNPAVDGTMAFPMPYPGSMDGGYAGYPMPQQGFGFQEMSSYYSQGPIGGAHSQDSSAQVMPEMQSPEEAHRASWQYSHHDYERVSMGYNATGDIATNPYPYQARTSSNASVGHSDQPEFDRGGSSHQAPNSFYPSAPKLQTTCRPPRDSIVPSAPSQEINWIQDMHAASALQEPYSATTASTYISPVSAYPNQPDFYQQVHDLGQGIRLRNGLYSEPDIQNLGDGWASHAYDHASEFHRGLAGKPQHLAVHLTLGRTDPADVLDAAAVEAEDDDYYDVLSDEEDERVTMKAMAVDSQAERDLGMVMDLYHQHSDDLGIRTMNAFITPGFVDIYRPEMVASPLRNEDTARVFAHFVTSTGPLLSPFERYHGVQSSMLRTGPVASATKSLWTHTLPMMALHNQGLLHAMLAMASMHMAKLSGASPASSFKHYAWSIKRVHKAVSHNRKRHEITTLAATLLLAFYEVMTADHLSWTKHLMGARQLIKEIDFAGMVQRLQDLKSAQAEMTAASHENTFNSILNTFDDTDDSFLDRFHAVDYHTIGYFMGRDVRQKLGHIEDDSGQKTKRRKVAFRDIDLQNFEILQDLFWWYCKQDMVHAGLAGTTPLLSYDDWALCPPRAPSGDLETVCGTFDHLTLLMGRVVTFAGEDRPRKLKASNASRPEKRGAPALSPPVVQSRKSELNTEPDKNAPGGPPPQMPFFGMAPLQSNRQAPSAYDKGVPVSPTSPNESHSHHILEPSVEESAARAEEEWQQIQAALDKFATMLGPAFEPMSKGEYPETDTPFGSMIVYRRYDIACVWMFYYMARIMHARAHPSMPAAALLAVPSAATYTAKDALTIGRIAASVTLPVTKAPLHPALAGAFTDSSLPLFWAGIQYIDAAQRAWTIRRLKEIEDHTGYASASLCALGCETSWTRAAERGGPPYVRQAALSIPDDARVRADLEGRKRSDIFKLAHATGEGIPEGASAYGALGILGTIEDLRVFSLADPKK